MYASTNIQTDVRKSIYTFKHDQSVSLVYVSNGKSWKLAMPLI